MFHRAFESRNYPKFVNESFIFNVFEQSLYSISEKISSENYQDIPNPNVLLSYIVSEYIYILSDLSNENVEKLLKDEEFLKRMTKSVSDKVFYNEYMSYKAKPLIDKYHPLISSFRFYLNFVLNEFTIIEGTSEATKLLIDMLKKAFLSCQGVTSLLINGFETEAFSTWRTIHEIECIAKIINDHDYLGEVYYKHIKYNKAFRNEFEDKDEQQKVINEIKDEMRQHNLKSKDLKKYIEYGWLFSIKNLENDYPTFKLNFRNGVQLLAGLTQYSKLYEMSSEIAHSSPILIYSSKQYFLELSLKCLYETFFRIEELLFNLLKNLKYKNSENYFIIRSIYLPELKLLISKPKLFD